MNRPRHWQLSCADANLAETVAYIKSSRYEKPKVDHVHQQELEKEFLESDPVFSLVRLKFAIPMNTTEPGAELNFIVKNSA